MLTQISSHTNLVPLADLSGTHNSYLLQEHRSFLQAILESLTDGILLLTAEGEQVYANCCARQMYARLNDNSVQATRISREVQHLWRTMVDRHSALSHQPLVVEAEISDREAKPLRVRARWLEFQGSDPYLLVTLEDYKQSLQNLAIAEVDKYKLTPREAEVWLLRRVGATYKDIATQLYVSVETVKKHLKNIYAKREAFLDRSGEY